MVIPNQQSDWLELRSGRKSTELGLRVKWPWWQDFARLRFVKFLPYLIGGSNAWDFRQATFWQREEQSSATARSVWVAHSETLVAVPADVGRKDFTHTYTDNLTIERQQNGFTFFGIGWTDRTAAKRRYITREWGEGFMQQGELSWASQWGCMQYWHWDSGFLLCASCGRMDRLLDAWHDIWTMHWRMRKILRCSAVASQQVVIVGILWKLFSMTWPRIPSVHLTSNLCCSFPLSTVG